MMIPTSSPLAGTAISGLAACMLLGGCAESGSPIPDGPQISGNGATAPIHTPAPPSGEPQIAGGYGESNPADEGAQEAVRMAQQAVKERLGKSTRVVGVQTQVVAGLNYRISLRGEDSMLHEVIVFRPLGARPLEVTSIK